MMERCRKCKLPLVKDEKSDEPKDGLCERCAANEAMMKLYLDIGGEAGTA